MTHNNIDRRKFIGLGGVALAGAALGGCGHLTAAQPSPQASPARTRVLRAAHITDIHVEPEKHAGEGFAQCLRKIHAMDDRPELILTGGDHVMEATTATAERTQVQWDLYQKILREECTIPVEHCLGNHDVWGWHKEYAKTTGDEPLYGKEWARQIFGVDRLYRSFQRAGWHFIVLDSVTFDGGCYYYGKLDDAQFAWLESELKSLDPATPVVVLSHIPILSAAVFFDVDAKESGDWTVPRAWMHIDAHRINALFNQYPNVRLCLSGHLHLLDHVIYNGVSYICDGAVCGKWWEGAYHQTPPGYGILDFYDDGSFEHQYIPTGWEPKE